MLRHGLILIRFMMDHMLLDQIQITTKKFGIILEQDLMISYQLVAHFIQ